jgi:excisionase family DNA binding protein
MAHDTATFPTRHDAAEASFSKLLDTAEAAKLLQMGKRTVQELTAERKLAFIKIGRSVRFDPADLRAFVEANRIKAAGWKKSTPPAGQ